MITTLKMATVAFLLVVSVSTTLALPIYESPIEPLPLDYGLRLIR
jgi:hypothetical protein